MLALVFQFQPNPMSRYFFLGLLSLVILWCIYSLIKEIASINEAFKKVDYEIVAKNEKIFIDYFVILNGKKRILKRKQFKWNCRHLEEVNEKAYS